MGIINCLTNANTTTTPTHKTMASSLIIIALAACTQAFMPSHIHSSVLRSRVIQMQDLMTPEKLEQAFARFDADGSGQVDWEEFMVKMKTLDMPFNDMELEQMFNQMDESSNGGVDADEFKSYVKSNAYVGVVRRLAASPNKIREVYE